MKISRIFSIFRIFLVLVMCCISVFVFQGCAGKFGDDNLYSRAGGKIYPKITLEQFILTNNIYSAETIDEMVQEYVKKTTTVNGKPLSGNITINSTDVGALSQSWTNNAAIKNLKIANQITISNPNNFQLGQTNIDSYISTFVSKETVSLKVYNYDELPASGPYTIKLSDGHNQAFINTGTHGNGICKEIILPQANDKSIGNFSIYLMEIPSRSFSYTISPVNIAVGSYFEYSEMPPWLVTKKDSLWKLDFVNILGSKKWYYVKATEYILE